MFYAPFLLNLFLMMFSSMMQIRTFATTTKRIAVVGCGVAGSTFARELLRSNDEFLSLQIDVFDGGRTPGGRASSMTNEFGTWDMGAQYISKPKTEDFEDVLGDWLRRGIVKTWQPRMIDCSSVIKLSDINHSKKYYVGMPSMQSICELPEDDHLSLRSNCNVECQYDRSRDNWKVTKRNGNQILGEYDWIVCTDRPHIEKTLLKNDLMVERGVRDNSQYTTTLSCMAAVKGVQGDQVPFDAIKLQNHPVLSYISIESSKPGRRDIQGEESLVITLQSSESFAKEIVKSTRESWNKEFKETKTKSGDKAFWSLRMAINKACEEPMYNAFYDLMYSINNQPLIPKEAAYMRGFRWGRSFPINPWKGSYEIRQDDKILAIGDYFDIVSAVDGKGAGTGRVETAAVSAKRGAQALRKEILSTCTNFEDKVH